MAACCKKKKDGEEMKQILTDMHTHSEHSHDSVCPIEEMCLAQLERGTDIFAVTDHCNVRAFQQKDVYTPIIKAWETVQELNKAYQGKIRILSGVEIAEGFFWFPEELKKLKALCPYDVIIGSVHCVRFGELTQAYSRIDFSEFPPERVYAYLDAYFDDMLAMIDGADFDVLAHLTCPLRYITGKYGISVDLGRFQEKIRLILEKIIARNIALEVNTSTYGVMGQFMPGENIVRQYYGMGGRLVTVGSDAHVAANAAKYIPEAVEMLKSVGFREVFYYQARKPQAIQI